MAISSPTTPISPSPPALLARTLSTSSQPPGRSFREDLRSIEARLAEQKKRQELLEYARQEAIRKELEWQKLREQRLIKEREQQRTKRYVELNSFGHKVAMAGEPHYYGDHNTESKAWCPDGKGHFAKDQVIVEQGLYRTGTLVHGQFYLTTADSLWQGAMKDGVLLHGYGRLYSGDRIASEKRAAEEAEKALQEADLAETKGRDNKSGSQRSFEPESSSWPLAVGSRPVTPAPSSNTPVFEKRWRRKRVYDDEEQQRLPMPEDFEQEKEVLMLNGIQVCRREDLIAGRQVDILNRKTIVAIANPAAMTRVTLLRHVRQWQWMVRYHEEVLPRERILDFSQLGYIHVLHHLPLILDHHQAEPPYRFPHYHTELLTDPRLLLKPRTTTQVNTVDYARVCSPTARGILVRPRLTNLFS